MDEKDKFAGKLGPRSFITLLYTLLKKCMNSVLLFYNRMRLLLIFIYMQHKPFFSRVVKVLKKKQIESVSNNESKE